MATSVPPPTLSSRPAVNHLTLFGAFQELFNTQVAAMQWPEADRPILVKSFPKVREGSFDTKFDVILFHIMGCETASTSNTRDCKPKGLWLYKTAPHPTKAGYQLVHYGWQEAVTVEFQVLAKANERADELVDWFHRMLMLYVHGMKFFQARGINEFRFQNRLEDTMSKEYGQELYSRPLRYTLRLELFDVAEAKTLDTINISVNGEQVQ